MSETHCLCEKCRNLMPTDNPSSGPSKGPTPGEEIIEKWIYSLPVGMRKNIAAEVDSAIASQEARHQQAIQDREQMRDAWETRAHEFIARAERAEQELAEAKRITKLLEGSIDGLIVQRNEVESKLREATEREKVQADLLEFAWGVIANAHGGNWDRASDEWREAAVRFREYWHELIGVGKLAALRSGPQEQKKNQCVHGFDPFWKCGYCGIGVGVSDAEPDMPKAVFRGLTVDHYHYSSVVCPYAECQPEPPSRPGGSRE